MKLWQLQIVVAAASAFLLYALSSGTRTFDRVLADVGCKATFKEERAKRENCMNLNRSTSP